MLRRAPTATTLRLPISGNWRDVVGRKLTVTLVDGSRSMTAPVTVTEGEGLIDLTTFATMLGLALIGGLILNLMPCVLPVLSLKLLAALPRTGETLRETRRGFLGTAMGIVLSFLVLAVATAAAKTAGLAVGWGVQFQDPLFLIALAVLLVLFACNLWGFFEVPLPRAVAAIAERGPIGSVATGAFATVLATPCSAPFVTARRSALPSRRAPWRSSRSSSRSASAWPRPICSSQWCRGSRACCRGRDGG